VDEKRKTEQGAANGNHNMSQMHLARMGVITEEMLFVAGRERLSRSWYVAKSPRSSDYSGERKSPQPGTMASALPPSANQRDNRKLCDHSNIDED